MIVKNVVVLVTILICLFLGCGETEDKEKTTQRHYLPEETANVCFVVCDSITQRALDFVFVRVVVDTGFNEGRIWATERTNIAGYVAFIVPQGLWRVYVNSYAYYPSGSIQFTVGDSLYRDTIWLAPASLETREE